MPAEPTSEPLKASYVWDIASDRIEWQPEAAAVLGLGDLKAVATGEAFASHIVAAHEPAWRAAVLGARASTLQPQGIGYRIQFALRPNATDPEIWVRDDGRWWPGADGRPSRAQGVLHRIDARYLETRHLLECAGGDENRTALNRTRLLEALGACVRQAGRNGRTCGLLMISVNGLGSISADLGPDVGDQVVEAVGRFIRAHLADEDAFVRYASNTFAVVYGTADETALSSAAESLIARVGNATYDVSSGPMKASVAVGGIALSSDADTVADAISEARSALEQAKRGSEGRPVIRSGPSSARPVRTKISSSDVIAAIEENRLLIALQPIVETASGKTALYEALVRLRRSDGTLIPAADFVEEAEMLGLARQVDRRALEMVLALLSRHPKLKLSLNVSSLTAGDRNWIETLERYAVKDPGLVPRLTVELTETAMIHDLDGMRAFVELLRAIGCRIAIDDFGTGYTSFRHLKTLPVDILKIDGVFVKDIPNDRHGRVIVGSLIEMARGLGLETVAEWVSDEKTAEFLSAAGATYLQGYLYAPPLPADDLERAGVL